MSLFDDAIDSAVPEMMEVFGESVFINGIELTGIVDDEQYKDEAGFNRGITISFDKSDSIHLEVDSSAVIKRDPNTLYRIRLPQEADLDDPFFTVELKHA